MPVLEGPGRPSLPLDLLSTSGHREAVAVLWLRVGGMPMTIGELIEELQNCEWEVDELPSKYGSRTWVLRRSGKNPIVLTGLPDDSLPQRVSCDILDGACD